MPAARLGLQAIITQRKRGDFRVSDSDQYASPHDCALEAARTQGRFLRLFLEPVEILAHVAERGKAPPPIEQRLQFQLRLDPTLFAAGVGHDAPVRVVDKTAPGVIMLRVLAAAVDAYDVS